MQHRQGSPIEVHIAIRAGRIAGHFDLVSVSDIDAPEESISMLDLSDVEHLSRLFWPDQDWAERLSMLKRTSPTPMEQWRAAQRIMSHGGAGFKFTALR